MHIREVSECPQCWTTFAPPPHQPCNGRGRHNAIGGGKGADSDQSTDKRYARCGCMSVVKSGRSVLTAGARRPRAARLAPAARHAPPVRRARRERGAR